MEKLILRYSEFGYRFKNCHGNSLGNFSVFLGEIGWYVLGFKRWALNPQETVSDLGFSTVRKKDGFIVILAKGENEADVFTIRQDDFVSLLDCWRELQRKYPQYIIFEYDGDYCFVYGENFPVPEQSVFDPIYWPAKLDIVTDIVFTMRRAANGVYVWVEVLCSSESILGVFVYGDLSWLGVDYFRQWLLDVNQIHFSGDTCLLLKKGNYIVIKDFAYFKNIQEHLVLTVEQFTKFLADWEQILKGKPEMLTVRCKNGDVTFEY